MTSIEPGPLPHELTRVTLRRLAVSDLSEFQSYRTDPEVGRYQGWSAMTSGQATAFLAEMNAGAVCVPDTWFQVGIADRLSDRLLGDIGVRLRNETNLVADMGFTLARPAQGRGLATEAVRGMMRLVTGHSGVERFEAVTDMRNRASVRLLERLGMLRERTLDAVFRGKPCCEYVYVVSREEFLSSANGSAT